MNLIHGIFSVLGCIVLASYAVALTIRQWKQDDRAKQLADQNEQLRSHRSQPFFIFAQHFTHAEFVARSLRLPKDRWVYLDSPQRIAGLESPLVIIYDTADRHPRAAEIREQLALRRVTPMFFHEPGRVMV